MYFKFSILLLFIVLAANSVLGENEDEIRILKKSYNDCRKWLGESLESTISLSQFWLCMGKDDNDLELLLKYLNKNKAASINRGVIDVNLYGELFKYLCLKLNYTIPAYAKLKKNNVLSKPLGTI